MLVTPPSLKEEHEMIMGSLRAFSRLSDQTGRVIGELLVVLEAHFEKEEELAMPVLGSLSDLALGKSWKNLKEIALSQAPLQEEYEAMFEEHSAIRNVIDRARSVAIREKHEEVSDLLDGLSHHARVEEEVLYPSALLAGRYANQLLNITVNQKSS